QLMVPFLLCGALRLELFNLVTGPHALQMLPREKQDRKKNQNAQSEQTETFTALLQTGLPHQTGVVNAFDKIDFRKTRPARGQGVCRTPPRFRYRNER